MRMIYEHYFPRQRYNVVSFGGLIDLMLAIRKGLRKFEGRYFELSRMRNFFNRLGLLNVLLTGLCDHCRGRDRPPL